jgi:hypothetical protein
MLWSRFAVEINTKIIFLFFDKTVRPTTVMATHGRLEMLIMCAFLLLQTDSDSLRHCTSKCSLLTSWRNVLLDKLKVIQLVKKFLVIQVPECSLHLSQKPSSGTSSEPVKYTLYPTSFIPTIHVHIILPLMSKSLKLSCSFSDKNSVRLSPLPRLLHALPLVASWF